jgi:uncharacterized protein YycO
MKSPKYIPLYIYMKLRIQLVIMLKGSQMAHFLFKLFIVLVIFPVVFEAKAAPNDEIVIGSTELASIGNGGMQANAGVNENELGNSMLDMTPDGRFVAFVSASDNLSPGDTNGNPDVFVRDRLNNITEMVSVANDGNPGNGSSYAVSISDDGQYVAFLSNSTNLVSGDTNNFTDIFIRDLLNQTTQLVSVATDGTMGNNTPGGFEISGDGNFVVFSSSASNLVLNDTNGFQDIFLRNLQTRTTTRVVYSPYKQSVRPSISRDGRYIALQAGQGGWSGYWDIYLKDMQGGTRLITTPYDGSYYADDISYDPKISADGQFVAFGSYASNLVPGDIRNPDIFVYDVTASTLEMASVDNEGTPQDGNAYSHDVSMDGRYVVFSSDSNHLVYNDTNGVRDIFLRDRLLNTTVRVSLATNGNEISHDSDSPIISADGRYILFITDAGELVCGDSNSNYDVFIRDRNSNTPVFSISGQATDPMNNPIQGVTILADNNLEAITGIDGKYTLNNVIACSYTFTPTKLTYVFEPVSRIVQVSVDLSGVNFIGSRTSTGYNVVGRVVDTSGFPIPGVNISNGSNYVVTDSDGTYAFSGLPPGSYTITPTSTTYTFSPPQQTLTLSEDMHGVNFSGTPQPAQCKSDNTGLDVCALQPGDILFWYGDLNFSGFNPETVFWGLRYASGSYWFHVAIFLGEAQIAHATGPGIAGVPEPDQVRIDSIYDTAWWTGEIHDWAVIRPLTNLQEMAVQYARDKANQTNPHILYNMEFFNKQTESAFYCSQLAWKAYEKYGLDLETNRGFIQLTTSLYVPVTPDDLYNSVSAGLAELVAKDPRVKDSSRTLLRIFSPADLLLTDPIGRRVGTDPDTGELFNEIPGAFYTGPNGEPESISILIPENGQNGWTLTVTGTGTGEYTLNSQVLNDSGIAHEKVITADTLPRQTDRYNLVETGLLPDLSSKFSVFLPKLSR